MLKPACLYADELLLLDIEKCYGNPFYQYYYGDGDVYSPLSVQLDEDHNNVVHFVSVDDEDNILGYIGYTIDHSSKSAKWWGIKSYQPSIIFARDCLQAVDDVFMKFNLNRIEWFAYTDNHAIRGYKKFIKKYGGRIVGILKQDRRLMDGKLHDTMIFELLREDYLKATGKEG
jgi:RimJ/RimL family protein N-acetyltransferase